MLTSIQIRLEYKSNIWFSSFYSTKVGLAPVNEAEKNWAQNFLVEVNQATIS